MQYEENFYVPWAPLVFFLPCFYKYGVQINDKDLVFGYGMTSPNSLISAKCIPLKDININTITTGNATWKDNLLSFGGWGIRLGKIHNNYFGWAYNPTNGSYVELETKNGAAYRFTTHDPETVKATLSRI